MDYDIFDILSDNERVIVYSDRGSQLIYTWNQSLTLQCWEAKWPSNKFVEIDIQTLSDQPSNFKEAQIAAITWSQT